MRERVQEREGEQAMRDRERDKCVSKQMPKERYQLRRKGAGIER